MLDFELLVVLVQHQVPMPENDPKDITHSLKWPSVRMRSVLLSPRFPIKDASIHALIHTRTLRRHHLPCGSRSLWRPAIDTAWHIVSADSKIIRSHIGFLCSSPQIIWETGNVILLFFVVICALCICVNLFGRSCISCWSRSPVQVKESDRGYEWNEGQATCYVHKNQR